MSATIDIDAATILFVEPHLTGSSRLNKYARKAATEGLKTLEEAAKLVRIPMWYLIYNRNEYLKRSGKALPNNRDRVFLCERHRSPWQQPELVAALKDDDRRTCLLMSGFWLDTGLGASALQAFSDGFDVHIISDMTFSKSPATEAMAARRLEIYGIVPVTLQSVIYELMTSTDSPEEIAGLSTLLKRFPLG